MRLTLISALALCASLADARTTQADSRSAATAAKAFSLDLPPAADPASPPSVANAAGMPAPGAASQPAVDIPGTPAMVAFTLDTPIRQLLADPRAKAVLDENMPGLSDDANLSKFQSLSLRQFQPMTGGQMSTALLAKTGADLAAIPSTPAMTLAPTPAPSHPTTSKKMDSGR